MGWDAKNSNSYTPANFVVVPAEIELRIVLLEQFPVPRVISIPASESVIMFRLGKGIATRCRGVDGCDGM